MRIVCDRETLGCELNFYNVVGILDNALELSKTFAQTFIDDLHFIHCAYDGVYVEIPKQISCEKIIQEIEKIVPDNDAFVHLETDLTDVTAVIILFQGRKKQNIAIKEINRCDFGEKLPVIEPISFSIGNRTETTLH